MKIINITTNQTISNFVQMYSPTNKTNYLIPQYVMQLLDSECAMHHAVMEIVYIYCKTVYIHVLSNIYFDTDKRSSEA